ncbi:hypothetical protein E2C01_085028 [Portunus trituberculatus]|uniref:Uncharacterized protein n=1 Tax=Portunus trituberculatus TaxID=210409 RepID=A0A5B7IZV6_PORTR|nr:hypothetical protein [Portunus trituberculatus]
MDRQHNDDKARSRDRRKDSGTLESLALSVLISIIFPLVSPDEELSRFSSSAMHIMSRWDGEGDTLGLLLPGEAHPSPGCLTHWWALPGASPAAWALPPPRRDGGRHGVVTAASSCTARQARDEQGTKSCFAGSGLCLKMTSL